MVTAIWLLLLLLVVDLLASAQLASAAGGDEADFLAWDRIAPDGRWVSNMLMVTAAVRMLNRVHRNATDFRPRVSLRLKLVEGSTRLNRRGGRRE